MAKEAAKAFVKRYATDEEFRDRVNGLDSPEAVRELLDQQGFGQFTREELEEVRSEASQRGELSDATLAGVAGGGLWAIVGPCIGKRCPAFTAPPCTTAW